MVHITLTSLDISFMPPIFDDPCVLLLITSSWPTTQTTSCKYSYASRRSHVIWSIIENWSLCVVLATYFSAILLIISSFLPCTIISLWRTSTHFSFVFLILLVVVRFGSWKFLGSYMKWMFSLYALIGFDSYIVPIKYICK